MKKLTKWWILSIACLAISGIAMGCGDNEDNENKGTGGTGGVAGHGGHGGTGGTGGTAGHGGTGGTGGTAGSGGTGGTGGHVELATIAGHVVANPLASAATFNPEGLEVRVVDALKKLQDRTNPDAGLLGKTTTDATGHYTLTDVDLSGVTLGAVITVAGNTEIATSTMGFCSPSVPSLPCETKEDFTTFVVPMSLVNMLQSNLGDIDGEAILAHGFTLGLVLEGVQPLAGVTITPSDPEEITFLDPTLAKSTESFTSQSGAFVLFPTGNPVLTPEKNGFEFDPPSQPVGTTANVVFQVFFVGSQT